MFSVVLTYSTVHLSHLNNLKKKKMNRRDIQIIFHFIIFPNAIKKEKKHDVISSCLSVVAHLSNIHLCNVNTSHKTYLPFYNHNVMLIFFEYKNKNCITLTFKCNCATIIINSFDLSYFRMSKTIRKKYHFCKFNYFALNLKIPKK